MLNGVEQFSACFPRDACLPGGVTYVAHSPSAVGALGPGGRPKERGAPPEAPVTSSMLRTQGCRLEGPLGSALPPGQQPVAFWKEEGVVSLVSLGAHGAQVRVSAWMGAAPRGAVNTGQGLSRGK